jgi:hypothetical protein
MSCLAVDELPLRPIHLHLLRAASSALDRHSTAVISSDVNCDSASVARCSASSNLRLDISKIWKASITCARKDSTALLFVDLTADEIFFNTLEKNEDFCADCWEESGLSDSNFSFRVSWGAGSKEGRFGSASCRWPVTAEGDDISLVGELRIELASFREQSSCAKFLRRLFISLYCSAFWRYHVTTEGFDVHDAERETGPDSNPGLAVVLSDKSPGEPLFFSGSSFILLLLLLENNEKEIFGEVKYFDLDLDFCCSELPSESEFWCDPAPLGVETVSSVGGKKGESDRGCAAEWDAEESDMEKSRLRQFRQIFCCVRIDFGISSNILISKKKLVSGFCVLSLMIVRVGGRRLAPGPAWTAAGTGSDSKRSESATVPRRRGLNTRLPSPSRATP